MSSVIEKWRDRFAATAENEDGAETIEIIIFLAIFVLGMVGVFAFIRTRAQEKGNMIGNCLNEAGVSTPGTISANPNCQ